MSEHYFQKPKMPKGRTTYNTGRVPDTVRDARAALSEVQRYLYLAQDKVNNPQCLKPTVRAALEDLVQAALRALATVDDR